MLTMFRAAVIALGPERVIYSFPHDPECLLAVT